MKNWWLAMAIVLAFLDILDGYVDQGMFELVALCVFCFYLSWIVELLQKERSQ